MPKKKKQTECFVCDFGMRGMHPGSIVTLFKTCKKHEEELTEEVKKEEMELMSEFKYPFGKDKGVPLDQVSMKSLEYLMGRCDISDPKFGAHNAKILAECQRIIKERKSGTSKPSLMAAYETKLAENTPPPAQTPNASGIALKQIMESQKRTEQMVSKILGIVQHNLGNTSTTSDEDPFENIPFPDEMPN